MTSVDIGGATVLGCPISSLLSLESACLTGLPACATATPVTYDAACCGSLESYGIGLIGCYEKHAPTCLDTSAAVASITGGASGTNPCAAFITGGGGGGGSSAGPASSAAVTTGGASAAGTGSATGGGSTPTSAGTSASVSVTTKNNAPHVGAGLKVYIGVALVGALAVLAM